MDFIYLNNYSKNPVDPRHSNVCMLRLYENLNQVISMAVNRLTSPHFNSFPLLKVMELNTVSSKRILSGIGEVIRSMLHNFTSNRQQTLKAVGATDTLA